MSKETTTANADDSSTESKGHSFFASSNAHCEAIRVVFDHIRNIGLCIVLASPARLVLELGGDTLVGKVLVRPFGVLFLILSALLFYINHSSLEYQIGNSPAFAKVRNHRWYPQSEYTRLLLYFAFVLIPALFAVEVINPLLKR